MVRRNALRLALGHLDQPPEEASGRVLVPVLAQHGVEQRSLAINSPIEVTPPPSDLHVGLVDVPGDPGVAAPLRTEQTNDQRGEAEFPRADRLVGDLEPALEPHLGDVAEAELVAEPPEHREEHDVRRVLEIVEGRAGPFIEAPPAGPAAEPLVAERGAARAPGRGRGCTVWTSPQRPLTLPGMRLAEASAP